MSISNSSRIAKNTMYLYIRMLFSMAVALYTSRVVLDVLGVEDFGVYNVVGGVVTLFAFFNSAMSSATQRFFSFELGRQDYAKLKQTFNATVNIHIVIAIVVFLLAETIGLWFVNNHLVLPEERFETVQWVYHFSVATFVTGIIKVPYNALIIAHERMVTYAYLSIIEVVLKLLIVYLLVVISVDKLVLYAILVFMVTLVIAGVYVMYCIRQFKESKYQFYYDSNLYKVLLSYSGWSLFGNIAAVSKGQGTNILLNVFFGPILNAAYGIMIQVQVAVNVFVSNFQLAVNPQIIKSYASGDKDKTLDLMFKSSKYSFFLVLILVLPIIFNVDVILEIWLTVVPEYTSVFIVLCLFNLLIDSISGPLMIGVQATGKIKTYQIVVGTLLFLNLPISYLAIKFFNRPELIFYVSISISILAFIFRLFFLKKLMGFGIKKYLYNVTLKVLIVFVPAYSLCYLITLKGWFFVQSEIISLILQSLIMIAISVLLCFVIGMSSSEKKFLKNSLNKILNK